MAAEQVLGIPLVRELVLAKLGTELVGVQSAINLGRTGVWGQETQTILDRYYESLREPWEPPAVSTLPRVTVAVLKEACRHSGLRLTGAKQALLHRLHPLSLPPRARHRLRVELMFTRTRRLQRDLGRLRPLVQELKCTLRGRIVLYDGRGRVMTYFK